MRSLATDLAINPNTIQRAYAELEREGFIYSVPGKGSFASDRRPEDPARREELIARLRSWWRSCGTWAWPTGYFGADGGGIGTMIELRDVVKTFDGFRALDGACVTVPDGAVYGLVGPNGAGKSTIIRHITGIYRPDSGQVLVEGEASLRTRRESPSSPPSQTTGTTSPPPRCGI